MNGFNTCPIPPKASGIFWVERIDGGAKLDFTCLSSHIFGIWTHFHKKGTRPCYEDTSKCEDGHKAETLRWKGYVHVYNTARRRQEFLQLTVRAARMWLEAVGNGCCLRGQAIHVSRTQASNGPVTLRLNEHGQLDEDRLAGERDDFMPSLFKLWKMAPVKLCADSARIITLDQLPPDEEMGQVG